ncbi:THAP domain-containing protein 1-like [Rhopilema esculentum]|uniref:THAP domain-containing protein 1-like n=1 Tax=Rhopilema esculentum TaxID=499914 RepID=UPI0031D68AFD
MPKSCAVYQCSATAATNKDSSFHQIPKDPKLRETWVKKIRREDFVPSASSYVCSFHFGEEDFSKGNPNTPLQFQKKSLKKGAIPMWNLRGTEGDQRISSRTFFTSHCARSSEPASEGEELPSMEQNADEVDPPTTTEKDPFQEVEQLQMKLTDARAEIERLKPRIFNFSTLTNDEIRNYTGLESSKFLAVVEMIESFQPLTYWSGKTVNSLSSSDQLLIFLMKMKLDLPYFDLAKRLIFS